MMSSTLLLAGLLACSAANGPTLTLDTPRLLNADQPQSDRGASPRRLAGQRPTEVQKAELLAHGAGNGPPLTEVQKAELAQYFGFGPFQVYKFKPGISDLRLADLNGDGRTDILLWNGYQSRFELLLQPDPNAPPADDARPLERNEVPNRGHLRSVTVPVTYKVAAVDIADLTADGIPDIVFFGEPREVVILPGKGDGRFGAAEGIRAPDGNPRYGCMATGDFNHDGRTDVALLGTDVLQIFLQKEKGGLAPPLRLVHGIKSPMLMLKADVNGDGRDDLIIGADDDRYGVYVCLQEESGTLAALRPVKIPRLRSMTVAKSASGHGGDDLYGVEYTTNRLKQYRWELPRESRVAGEWVQRLHSYPIKSTSKQRPLALGDIDGDGRVDCVTVDPDAAQMVLFKGEAAGLGAGTAFPALTKTSDVCIADADLDGRQEVLLVSPDEKTIGVSHYEDGRLTFPAPLAAHGEPFVVAVGGLHAGDKADHLAYVTREDRAFSLVVRAIGQTEESTYEVGDLDDNPSALRFVDLNQDGRIDLLLFVRFAAPIAFLQTEDGKFERFAGAERRAGMMKEVAAAGWALADVTGDGLPELLIAQDNFVRALTIRDGRWTAVDQYNPEAADARITGIAALPGEPGSPTLVMYDRKAEDLLVFKRREDHTYGVVQSMPVGTFELTTMNALPIGKDGKTAVLMADPTKLAVLTPDEAAPTLIEKNSYESETKDAFLADAEVGDLNHDGVRDVVVVDMGKAALEILTTAPGGDFVQALRFQVFQGRRFSESPDSRGEPREMLIGDVTGDGIDDIVLIVHDRVILYPGQ